MERLPGLRALSSFFANFAGEDVVVRPADENRDPFEFEAMITKSKRSVPITLPIYAGDIVERVDPRGGVLEYEVTTVTPSPDPFGHGNDHAVVLVREKGHAARTYGTTHVHIQGGTNQVAINSDGAQMSQVWADNPDLIRSLGDLLASVPSELLSTGQIFELREAIEDVEEKARFAKPGPIKRSLLAVKGIVEELGASAKAGTNDALKVWVKAALATVALHLTGINS